MQSIGKYRGRQIFWLDYNNFTDQLPDKGWVCLAISNIEPEIDIFEKFVRTSISKNILEFKGHGRFGEKLHDLFDEIMVEMEVLEKHAEMEVLEKHAEMEVLERHAELDVMTTWHNDETLAETFWQCFFATCLPGTADLDNIKIICTDLDQVNRIEELKGYIKEFGLGWLPSDNVKHEVWQDKEGLTTLFMADEKGDESSKLLDPGSKLIHVFYANSHFEAMTIYYKFMDWGTYTTEFEVDKLPYGDKN